VFLAGFEALVVVLLFFAPGALFLYKSARYYSPTMRGEYLRHQFPLELAVHYILASTFIHGILLFLLACVLFVVTEFSSNHNLVQNWYEVLTKFPRISTSTIVAVMMVGWGYLGLSLLLAYLGAILFRRYLLLPEPLWCGELIRILELGDMNDVQLVKHSNDVVEGKLLGFRLINEQTRSYELLIRVLSDDHDKSTTVWLTSEVIRSMKLTNRLGTWQFIFAPEQVSKQGDV
jgi:hypothetical protein